jgi:hypothetical protein
MMEYRFSIDCQCGSQELDPFIDLSFESSLPFTKNSIALNNKGWSLISLGNSKEAITYLDKALA